MGDGLSIRTAETADLDAIERLLTAAALPTAGVAAVLADFLLIEVAGKLAACGGLEIHGDCALLRSLVVQEAMRRQGLGDTLCAALLRDARLRGIDEVYLLTTTAPQFFARHGFRAQSREQAPSAIRASQEFSQLCPQVAILMRHGGGS